MDKIIFATGNKGKMKEIREIFKDTSYMVLSMEEARINADIKEDGTTFEENALIKARAVAGLSGEIAMADDSGLEVDFLDKAPGVYSARFLGEDTSYEIKNQYILDKLKGVGKEQRTARFVCAIAVVFPDGREAVRTACIEGIIADVPAGENGFGYDPIFYVPEFKKTTAELTMEQKNQISHRAKALAAIKDEVLFVEGKGDCR
ncbi:MAG: XTP/dITP diphosphatase [Lachnospiraceae bacterium]|nr:XTP/dITP diphosphatase [Lachnospiraceae bacterium]